jgi:hypothetical protein
MGLLDTLPTNDKTLEYMIGAVAFERSFAELYHVLQDNEPCNPREGALIVVQALIAGDSPYIDVAHKAVVHVYADEVSFADMRHCLTGYIAEARDRFVMRALEVEVSQMHAKLDAWSGADMGGDAPATFSR